MKNLIRNLLFSLLLTAMATPMALATENPGDPTWTFPISQIPGIGIGGGNDKDPDEPVDPEKGERAPARRLICTISLEDGIYIPGVDAEDILLMEIETSYSGAVVSFTDAVPFIEFLSTLSGSCQIYLHTADKTYTGTLSL